MIVAHVPDLMDRSKITAAATPDVVEFVRSPADLAGLASEARLLVVDLARPGVLPALAALPDGTTVIGFGSHVDRGLLDDARRAGCTQVLARSEFFRRAAELLAPGGVPPAST